MTQEELYERVRSCQVDLYACYKKLQGTRPDLKQVIADRFRELTAPSRARLQQAEQQIMAARGRYLGESWLGLQWVWF
jgi:hypothetical protein